MTRTWSLSHSPLTGGQRAWGQSQLTTTGPLLLLLGRPGPWVHVMHGRPPRRGCWAGVVGGVEVQVCGQTEGCAEPIWRRSEGQLKHQSEQGPQPHQDSTTERSVVPTSPSTLTSLDHTGDLESSLADHVQNGLKCSETPHSSYQRSQTREADNTHRGGRGDRGHRTWWGRIWGGPPRKSAGHVLQN